MMSKRQTQEQKRAKQAWKNVHDEVAGKDFAKEYKRLVSSAPTDVQTNGLGQTVAFWRSKGELQHKTLYRHLSDWVMLEMGEVDDLMHWITQTTVEALAFLGWLKRFAQAEL
jgi:CRISPR-associated protein Cmr5